MSSMRAERGHTHTHTDRSLQIIFHLQNGARRSSKFIVGVLLILIELVLIEADLLRLHTSDVLQ